MAIEWNKYQSNRWSPESIGDAIAGRIVNIREEDGHSGALPVLTIATEHGEQEVWAGQKQLQQRLADLRPEPGDNLSIKLTDLVNTGQPSPMKRFNVRKSAPVAEAPDEEPF